MKKYLLLGISLLLYKSSLRYLSWREVRTNHPLLYSYRFKRIIYFLSSILNKPLYSFVSIGAVILALSFSCTMPHHFDENRFHYVLINITPDLAVSLLTSNIQNAASLIGLSFVVIGFMFELIKERTGQNFQDLFRTVFLYPILSFSLCVMLFHVIAYALSATVDRDTTLLNLGLLSVYLMSFLILSIAFLFLRLVKFFSTEHWSEYSTKLLRNAARYKLLDDLLVDYSGRIYESFFAKLGMENQQYGLEGSNKLCLRNSSNTSVLDVNFFLLSILVRKFLVGKPEPDNVKFIAMHLNKKIARQQGILDLPTDYNPHPFLKVLIQLNYFLYKGEPRGEAFNNSKSQLVEKLHSSAKNSDTTMLKQQLSDIDEIYKIYYESIQ